MTDDSAPVPDCQGCFEHWPLAFVKGATLEGRFHVVPRSLVEIGAFDRWYRCTEGLPSHGDR